MVNICAGKAPVQLLNFASEHSLMGLSPHSMAMLQCQTVQTPSGAVSVITSEQIIYRSFDTQAYMFVNDLELHANSTLLTLIIDVVFRSVICSQTMSLICGEEVYEMNLLYEYHRKPWDRLLIIMIMTNQSLNSFFTNLSSFVTIQYKLKKSLYNGI